MTKEIDWPMTVGTLALAMFIGWVVLAMYRPPHQAQPLEVWARSAVVVPGTAVPAAQRLLPDRQP